MFHLFVVVVNGLGECISVLHTSIVKIRRFVAETTWESMNFSVRTCNDFITLKKNRQCLDGYIIIVVPLRLTHLSLSIMKLNP